jgi:2,3-bisphosphoglycerate-independent phosphoglycerate mutase
MSDVPLEALDGRTPLQVAEVPALDALSAKGRMGRVKVVPAEIPTGSVVGVPALLGYDAVGLALRRGPLEAAGLGVPLKHGDVALRLNFVSTFRETMADTRAGHVSDREARVLLEALKRISVDLPRTLHLGAGYRHLLVLQDAADLEFGTVPPQEVLGHRLGDFYPVGRDAEPLVQFLEAAEEVLRDHDVNRVRVDLGENPADAVWLWGEGSDAPLPPLPEIIPQPAAMVAAAPLVRGLALKAAMTCPAIAGATAEQDTALTAKCTAARQLAQTHSFVMLHVAAVNEASRAGDAEAKVQQLERLDQELVAPLLQWVEEDFPERRLLVTSDHQTSVEMAPPAAESVPFVLFGNGLEGVRSRTFSEATAAAADVLLPDAASLLEFFLRGGAQHRTAP